MKMDSQVLGWRSGRYAGVPERNIQVDLESNQYLAASSRTSYEPFAQNIPWEVLGSARFLWFRIILAMRPFLARLRDVNSSSDDVSLPGDGARLGCPLSSPKQMKFKQASKHGL